MRPDRNWSTDCQPGAARRAPVQPTLRAVLAVLKPKRRAKQVAARQVLTLKKHGGADQVSKRVHAYRLYAPSR